MKMTTIWRQSRREDDLKNKDQLQNEENLTNEDSLIDCTQPELTQPELFLFHLFVTFERHSDIILLEIVIIHN